MKNYFLFLASFFVIFSGCNTGVQPINYGKENCELCKMTIMNNQFAAELITKKGKFFKFDDIHCLTLYIKNTPIPQKNIKQIFITDFSVPGKFIDAFKAKLIKSENLRSPMEGNIAAFENSDSTTKFMQQYNAIAVDLKSIIPE